MQYCCPLREGHGNSSTVSCSEQGASLLHHAVLKHHAVPFLLPAACPCQPTQSANVAYKYGVSGPFWYAAGATVQVLLFAILAVEIKRKAPTTHTCLEIVKARWGTPAHLVFLVFALLTNIIVTSMLILGGAWVEAAAS